MKPIHKVLIANRGEIASRIIRTCRDMGLETVAVHSDADAAAPFVREADEAVRIGPAPSAESYLVASAILEAAARTGADAVHPATLTSRHNVLPRRSSKAKNRGRGRTRRL